MRDLQSEGVQPLMTSLDDLRTEEMEPLYFQIEELSRQQEAIYRERIMPLEQQLNRMQPDDRAFSMQQEEFDIQMREINQLERQLEAESWQMDRGRRRQELELRVESEDTMRVNQDTIEEMRQELHELYRTWEITLDELYREQSGLYSGYSDPYHESEEAMSLRDELGEIEWKIANNQVEFDDGTSSLQQETTTLEWEVQQLRQALEQLERERVATLDQLEELYRQIEVGFNGGTASGSLEQQLNEVRASLGELDLNDPDVLALAAELVALETQMAEGAETHELRLAAVKQEITSLETEVSRIKAVVGGQETLLASKKETLDSLYSQLDELRMSVSTSSTSVDGTVVVETTVGDDTQIAALEAEIEELEAVILTISRELDENWDIKHSVVSRLDELLQEAASLDGSTMDEGSLYNWMEDIRVRLNNILMRISSDV